jgi:C-terminal processing protease CtpA/Prc
MRYFHRAEWGGETAKKAMNSLADCSSLVIDLRECGGGYPDMVSLVLSYLLGEEPVHLSTIYWQDDSTTQEFWTTRDVPGKKLNTQPVYVLTSRVTFSAGEAFAYIVQTRKRGMVVGEKTDGGAHPGASYRLHDHFEAFIPVGRLVDALTGTDWEGTGVVPDVAVPAEEALEVAYRMAREK